MTASLALATAAACSTKIGTAGTDQHGRPVFRPVFYTAGDMVGELTLTTNWQGESVFKLTAPPPQEYPMLRVAVLDRKGTQVIGYNEIPLAPGIYHSRAHTSFFDGLAKVFRSLSNVAGTIISGLIGLEWARNGILTSTPAQ